MWETFISWYINNYLGNYIENLNSQQLSVALSSGELELENVPLKKNIFRYWGVPIEIKSSIVGRIKVEFNILKYFRNEPVIVTMEDVCVVAGPINLAEWSYLDEEEIALETKMSALDMFEARWKAQFDAQQKHSSSSYYSALYYSSMRIGTSIVAKVVENLKLKVKNVHVRYEQEFGKSKRHISFGLTLDSLDVQSCNEKWEVLSSWGGDTSEESYKLLKMTSFGVYCDTKAEKYSQLDGNDLKIYMMKSVPPDNYVLRPVSVESRVTKNNSNLPLTNPSKPRFDVKLHLENVPLRMTDIQYQYSCRVYRWIRKLNRNCRLHHYRPNTSVKGNAREWWLYAIQAVLSIRGFRRRRKLRSWDDVLTRAAENCQYVKAYQNHLTGKILSSEERSLKDRMESKNHYEDIVDLRKIAMQNVEKEFSEHDIQSTKDEPKTYPNPSPEASNESENSGGFLSWMFPSWGNRSLQEDTENSPASPPSSLPPVNELQGGELGFDDAILNEIEAYDKDALLGQFHFQMDKGNFLLIKKATSFLEFCFENISLDFLLRPRSNCHQFKMKVKSAFLLDASTKIYIMSPNPKILSPTMCGSVGGSEMEPLETVLDDPLLTIVYDIKPHVLGGHRVVINTQPVDITLNPFTWEEVRKFFFVKAEEGYLEIALDGYEALKQKTKEELHAYWERIVHQRSSGDNEEKDSEWEISVELCVPYFTVSGFIRTSNSVVTLPDLNNVKNDGISTEVGLVEDSKTNSVSDEDEEFLTPCSSPVPFSEVDSPPTNVFDDADNFQSNCALEDTQRIRLSCSDFSVTCSCKGYVTETVMSVRTLKLEDMNCEEADWNRIIAISCLQSHDSAVNALALFRKDKLSNSCPNILKECKSQITIPEIAISEKNVKRIESSSLPEDLTPEQIFAGRYNVTNSLKSLSKRKNAGRVTFTKTTLYPETPPPSPQPIEAQENLIQVHITMIDSKSPLFLSQFGGNHKRVLVNFNTLDVLLTPAIISFVKKFFIQRGDNPDNIVGQGNRSMSILNLTTGTSLRDFYFKSTENLEVENRNSEIVVKVKALALKLAGLAGHVAEATVKECNCEFKSRGSGYFGVEGRLGSLELKDITGASGLYPVKFQFQGNQALDFDYARTGSEAKFRLNMSSIVVVHTHRFYSEIMNLWSHLFEDEGKINYPVRALENPDVTDEDERVRVILDIQAGAPVLIFPCSSMSENVLVADLGHLSVKNKFQDESSSGYVINLIHIDLIRMDLYSAVLLHNSQLSNGYSQGFTLQPEWKIVKTVGNASFLKNQCALSLTVRKLCDGLTSEKYPSTHVQGTLSTVFCTLDSSKYKLIRGLLAYNLGEKFEISNPHSASEDSIYKRPKTLNTSTSHQSVVDFELNLDLVDVTLEVLRETMGKLGKVNFIKSKFNFRAISDGTKEVGLTSQEIRISDSRFEDCKAPENCNVFTNIIQPCCTHNTGGEKSKNGSSSGTFHSEIPLQAELHYRRSFRGSNVTIVLNNMRLMVILDWWIEVRDYLSQDIPKPHVLHTEDTVQVVHDGHSPVLERSKNYSRPVTVSMGIVSKRAPVLDIPENAFDLKINISNCEMVLVEKACRDTNALILKGSAVLGYRPHLERPVSCSLNECELFSCILGLETETALSIVDPATIHIELLRQTVPEPQGIPDATYSLNMSGKLLKIQSANINLRLSYHDMKMFIRMMDKFSEEAKSYFGSSQSTVNFPYENSALWPSVVQANDVEKLIKMGFTRAESIEALHKTSGNIADAVIYLTTAQEVDENFKPPEYIDDVGPFVPLSENGFKGPVRAVEIKCSYLSLCLIDDCKDSDIPLLEIGIQQLQCNNECSDNYGSADCKISIDYYNRELSGWEPFLEPWECHFEWKKNLLGQLEDPSPTSEFPSRAPEYEFYLMSDHVMDFNITATFLNLCKTVIWNWTEDYQYPKPDRQRVPFVPFALKNDTGTKLWFSTILSTKEDRINQHKKEQGLYNPDRTSWIEVPDGGVQNFSFEGRGKLRHRNTHQLKTHQLIIKVDGWHETTPISVDRVGTYFRSARPETNSRRFGNPMDLPSSRLLVDVSLPGSARKLVTARSSLRIKNALPDVVELKMENTIIYPSLERAQTGGCTVVQLKPNEVYAVPLHSVWAYMWIRPLVRDVFPRPYLYCTKALLVGKDQEGVRECLIGSGESSSSDPYKFCVSVKHSNFLADADDAPKDTFPSIAELMSMSKKANVITLVSAFEIENLLPVELTYEVYEKNIKERIAPGQCNKLNCIDPRDNIEIFVEVENFPNGGRISITKKSNVSIQKVKLQDYLKRTLHLNAKIIKREFGAVTVQISCPCWVVNKSGLPLVCKQDGTNENAAGQFEEHEVGRMVTPLMMSFIDQENGEALTLRVGSNLHKNSKPFFCHGFPCQPSARVRKLSVSHRNNRPETVYLVGIEIKNGIGRYRDTRLVVVSPRFVVDNRSSYTVQISQKTYATSFYDAKAEETHLSLPAGCNLPFHWPRLDKEQLLCIKLKDMKGSFWSGGFLIDNVDSFHVNVRDAEGKVYFIRVEVVVQGPSFFVIFSDSTQLPPPFRVDNFSFVPITFYQSCVSEERLKITAKAETVVHYALDEPTQNPTLTISAPGGTSTTVDLNELRYNGQLVYENFFYIALSATFLDEGCVNLSPAGLESLQLVLDVPEGTKVILSKKEPGKRSQLWRVNADGMIEHEGSSPPRDAKRRSHDLQSLVLDIAGPAPLPTHYVSLMLRKPDKRRSLTQHWEFTMDGRLKCSMYDSLYVQVKDGFNSMESGDISKGKWRQWSDVVLGPCQPVCFIRTQEGIPAEQAVARQKLRPGSGILSLCVEMDGPTRVLRIVDVEHPPRFQMQHHTFADNDYNTTPKCQIKLQLSAGVGLSLVSCNPREELVYASFTGVMLDWTDTKNSQVLCCQINNIQVDNQLLESEKSAVVFVVNHRSETSENLQLQKQDLSSANPVATMYFEQMKSNLNARVFKVFEIVVNPLSLIIEETLLLKLSLWLGLGQKAQDLDVLQQMDFEVQKALINTTSRNTRRYYFGQLKICLDQVKLSVLTSSKLPPKLYAEKRRLGLSLIRFEDANVELDPFEKYHPFETFEFMWTLLIKHYRDELVSQAAIILGSTDFLGNPLGFVNDVSEGVSLMIYEGSVGALVKNVAHGLSNSAAKMTETLGEGLGKTILDDKHEDERRKIKGEYSSSSGDYLYGGIVGFTHGLIGGVTSVVTQSYEGASKEGVPGFFSGLTKGVVGTITKPAVGVLDLATGAASAIRDSSKTSSRLIPKRIRRPRVAVGNGGLLPPYSEVAASCQELLFELNERNYSELYISCESIRAGANQDLRIMISSEAIYVFGPSADILLKVPISELIECQIAYPRVDKKEFPYVELVRLTPASPYPSRPQVVCENEQIGRKVVQQINYAKLLHDEIRHSEVEPNTPVEED